MTLLYLLNLFGVAVFAISGALAAIRKRLDLLGVIVLAVVTAIGGGTLRDLLLNRHPIFWFQEIENLVVILGATAFTLIYVRFGHPPRNSLLVADALGLATFTITGTHLSIASDLPAVIAIIMGVMTGVAGGMVRDILAAEIPMILRGGDLYATAAIIGASLYLLLGYLGISQPVAGLAGASMVAFLRLGSVAWGLRLPVFALPDSQDEG